MGYLSNSCLGCDYYLQNEMILFIYQCEESEAHQDRVETLTTFEAQSHN